MHTRGELGVSVKENVSEFVPRWRHPTSTISLLGLVAKYNSRANGKRPVEQVNWSMHTTRAVSTSQIVLALPPTPYHRGTQSFA